MTYPANQVWLANVSNVLQRGHKSSPRDQVITELIGYSSTLSMAYPLVTVPERRLSLPFACAEALWIFSGSHYLFPLMKFAPSMERYSDDGKTLFGAYGPKIYGQFEYVIQAFLRDRDTRQAVINIWRENPPISKDIPCTCSVQWLIRDNRIHCVDNMRSSDLWLGWPYDVFTFSMITALIALTLKERADWELDLGHLTLNAGSQHIYERNREKIELCSTSVGMPYEPLDLREYAKPSELLSQLTKIRDGKMASGFLSDVVGLA